MKLTKDCISGSLWVFNPPPPLRPCWPSVWRGFPWCAGHRDEEQVKSPLLWAQCTQTHRSRSCDQLSLHPRCCHLEWIPESTSMGKETSINMFVFIFGCLCHLANLSWQDCISTFAGTTRLVSCHYSNRCCMSNNAVLKTSAHCFALAGHSADEDKGKGW